MKSNAQISENGLLGSITTRSILNLLPKSVSKKHQRAKSIHQSLKCDDTENTPPVDPNVPIDAALVSPSGSKKVHVRTVSFRTDCTSSDQQEDKVAVPPDPSVKIVVRIRPSSWRERGGFPTVRKVSSKSLAVGERVFEFDSVVDSTSTQEDLFNLVGAPAVKNSLAGYNTSILLYGQTGSGKTFTMWGPPSAMVEGHSPSTNQGICPRIFKMLFSEIQKEREISGDKQTNYQCRCSFLEIYNEQIGDLLDPTQRNLEIRDDAKNGFYVENLSEEYVTSYDDVTQILIKGLSNRKVGATSINSKSSRSHIVFTCIVESWCKGNSSKGFSSSKTSRITLVDLAGSETNKLDANDANRQCIKENRNVKKSLGQLGNLVNTLAQCAQMEKRQDVSYRSSCLTHLLRESIGGNAKLTVICAVSPDDRCRGETLSTLRFGQRAQAIVNEPVINEITEEDVNGLSDQIRQLKEELIKAKSTGYSSVGSNSEYFKGRNARESLNQLRVSLNRSLILPHIENDSDEETNADEEDVKDLCVQLENLRSSYEEDSRSHPSDEKESFHSFDDGSDTDSINDCITSKIACTEEISDEEGTHCENTIEENTRCGEPENELPYKSNESITSLNTSTTTKPPIRSSLSVIPCLQPSILEPILSESPKFENTQKKSVSISCNNLASQNNVSGSSKFSSEVLRQSVKRSDHIRASLRSSILSGPTESLAASLHRGLQIIDNHQRSSVSSKPSLSFSFDHFALKPCQEVDKSDAGVQTSHEDKTSLDGKDGTFICSSCKQAEVNGANRPPNNWIVPVDGAGTPTGSLDRVPEDTEKALAEALEREKELENVCAVQVAKIEQLNQLVEQYKLDKERSSVHLDALTTGVDPIENLKKDGQFSSQDDNKLLEFSCENQPDTPFGAGEKESLRKEIESLRSRLQFYIDTTTNESSLRSDADAHFEDRVAEEVEKERQRRMEMESEWISLTDELRINIEVNRQLAEKLEMELRLEKKVTAELDDALDRSVLGHARFIEHYVELQDKYNELLSKHRSIMEGVAEIKRAAAKAGAKGKGARFQKCLAAELSTLRVERQREAEHLKKENKNLKIQLRDTADAVHAAGELLVRLREAEQAVQVAEENMMSVQNENEKVKKQMEKQKRKHQMEMVTMKQYLAESRLPESALQPLYWQQEEQTANTNTTDHRTPDDDQSWRAAFGPAYHEHY